MFITLEGPDGSGKTSQVNDLADYLRTLERNVYVTREPGGSPISTQVRAILMDLDNKAMHPRTETLLFCAARAQHVEEVIRPHLAAGEIVLCDRYADSTLAYQGYGHGNDLDDLRTLLDFTTGGLKPNLTILFDISSEDGLKRRRTGGGEWNRLDDYALAFHRKVRQGYHALASQEPDRWATIDASCCPEDVQAELRRVITDRL